MHRWPTRSYKKSYQVWYRCLPEWYIQHLLHFRYYYSLWFLYYAVLFQRYYYIALVHFAWWDIIVELVSLDVYTRGYIVKYFYYPNHKLIRVLDIGNNLWYWLREVFFFIFIALFNDVKLLFCALVSRSFLRLNEVVSRYSFEYWIFQIELLASFCINRFYRII